MTYIDVEEELDRRAYDGNWGGMMEISEAKLLFPDIGLVRDCHGKTRIVSPSVNKDAWRVEFQICEKCAGAVKAFIFLERNRKGDRVYADPPEFEVADVNLRGFGLVPRNGWKAVVQAAGIDNSVIKEVENYLARHQPAEYI